MSSSDSSFGSSFSSTAAAAAGAEPEAGAEDTDTATANLLGSCTNIRAAAIGYKSVTMVKSKLEEIPVTSQ